MPSREKNRSDEYQHLIMEIDVCPFIMSDLSAAQGLSYKMQPTGYDDELYDLQEKLKKRLWQIIDEGLTNRQKQVIYLCMKNYTQNEIAKELGINQTSVHKVIKGNIDYKNGKKRYGGAFKKIIKLCKDDTQIQNILREIEETCGCLEL